MLSFYQIFFLTRSYRVLHRFSRVSLSFSWSDLGLSWVVIISTSFTGFQRVLLGFTGFYRVLPGFPGFTRVSLDCTGSLTGFSWLDIDLNWVAIISLGFIGFERVLLGFTGFYRVLPGFTGFYWVFKGITWLHWFFNWISWLDLYLNWDVIISMGLTGFYWVFPGFTEFSRVSFSCTDSLSGFS